MILRPASFVLALSLTALAQTPASIPAPPSLIDELVANAQLYRATVPSLTADEDIESKVSYLGMFPDKTVTHGTMRILRDGAGPSSGESRQFLTINGKPVAPDAKPHLPLTLFGGFGAFQEFFLAPSQRPCFQFRLLEKPGPGGTVQIDITALPKASWPPQCSTKFQQSTGLIRLDSATHQVAHFERTVPETNPDRGNLAPFASVDCAPTLVGDQTFWLPATVIARNSSNPIHAQFTAHYSNFHRYAATLTLLPGATEVPPPTEPGATPPPP